MVRSKALWALVIGLAALHVALATALPLVEDEAYYRLWATVPSAGYYDHPPMVAWGIALGEALFGASDLAARAASIAATSLVVLITARIAARISGDIATGFRAALLLATMLPVMAFGFVATPDPWSVLFWTAAVWALIEVQKGGSRIWWLAVGLFAGLGVLAKFTNLFFGVALILWLVASRDGRRHLKDWQVWAGAALGLVVLIPFARWNLQNDWIGFERQFGRIAGPSRFSLMHFAMFWLSLVVLVTPGTFALTLRGMARRAAPPVLIWLIAPILLYLTWHALKSVAGGQWLAPIFPILAVMAALAASARAARFAAGLGAVLAVGVLAAGFWPGKALIGGHNPFTQGRGWAQVVTEITAEAGDVGAQWIATDAYGLTGQLANVLPDRRPVWSVTEGRRYLFRGPFPDALCAAPGLFLSRTAFPYGVPYFARSEPRPDIVRREGGRVLMRYYVARVEGLLACPPPF